MFDLRKISFLGRNFNPATAPCQHAFGSILIPFLVFASLFLGALFGHRMGFCSKPEGAGWFMKRFFQIEENFVDDMI